MAGGSLADAAAAARKKRETAAKKTGPAAQAETLASKPKPSPSPSPSPSSSSGGGMVEGSEYIVNNARTGLERRKTVRSATPQADELKKIDRIKTLSDDEVLAKAKEGYVDYSVEARRRQEQGNAKFKDYGK